MNNDNLPYLSKHDYSLHYLSYSNRLFEIIRRIIRASPDVINVRTTATFCATISISVRHG